MAERPSSLRRLTASGSVVNGLFQVGIVTLGLVKGVAVAVFLDPSEYAIWGILIISITTIAWLKQVGVADKFVQQDEPDQELAWQRAFTFELLVSAVFFVVVAAVLPVLAAVYGQSELVAPGIVLAATFAVGAFQAPTWILYRRMEFFKQRLILSVDAVIAFVVTVGLAAAGVGYWSLVIGQAAGALGGALAAFSYSPYRYRLRYDSATARDYLTFSWPLFVATLSSLVIAQASVITGEAVAGLAGAGALTLAATISQYADRVDGVVTATLYPAICAVKDRRDLLFESFVKSNRLTLMWGVPFGVGLALFASDLVEFGLGEKWEDAVILLQVFGLTAAAGHLGFNWDAFYRARGETRPIALWSFLTMLCFLAVPLPLLIFDGLTAFAYGMGVMTLVSLAVKTHFLTRLFDGFQMLRHAIRAVAPTVPGVAIVVVMRALEGGGDRTVGLAVAELMAFAGIIVAVTLRLERDLLLEVAGYLRRPRSAAVSRPA